MRQINTSCQYCCFRQNNKEGTQEGCSLGRIDRYRTKGVAIEQKDKFFIIQNKFCDGLRTKGWADKQDNPEEAVYKEIALKCDFIIMSDGNINKLEQTLKTVVAQRMPPSSLRINTVSYVGPTLELLGDIAPDNLNYFVDDVREEKLRLEDMIDISANKCTGAFYAVFHNGFLIPNTYLEDINNSFNNKLDRFCLLIPHDRYNGMFVDKALHDSVFGNKELIVEKYEDGELVSDNIIDKAKFFGEQTKTLHMIKEVNQVCQNM